jgi:hypothetical protein
MADDRDMISVWCRKMEDGGVVTMAVVLPLLLL